MKKRDKLAVSIVGMVNLNPEKKDRVVKRLKLLSKAGKLGLFFKRGFELKKYNVGEAKLEIYKKKGTSPKKMIYVVHGGAFILELVHVYRGFALKLAKSLDDTAVALIDYRTAPKYTYPAAHDDVMAGWQHLQDLGFEPANIALAGDSCGGNLILSLLLRLRDEGKGMPALAVLMSPWADLLATGESYKNNYGCDIIFGRKKSKAPDDDTIQKILQSGVFSYTKNVDVADPYLSPILGEYHGMPPILMTAGSHEMLLDDTLTIAKKIEQAGGSVKLILGEGMFHSYPIYYSISPMALDAVKQIIEFIKIHLK